MKRNRKLLVRFLLVLFGGVVLVWIFGVESGEDLLGRRSERMKVSEEEAARVRAERRDPDTDVGVTGARIPVREKKGDPPGVQVLKYVIHIGSSATGAARRMEANDVSVDLFNGAPEPDQALVARVRGERAIINFLTAPNAADGFQGVEVDSMSLFENVLVQYLNKDEVPIAQLVSDQLDLSESEFRVPGHARVTQEGLLLEGEGLLYRKSTGGFSFERNVRVEGTVFHLPDPDATAEGEAAADPGAVPPEMKTIACKGRFEYVPADEEDSGAAADAAGAEMMALAGGLLVFEEQVEAKQGETVLRADLLEITLESRPPPEGEEGGKRQLEVSQVVARGNAADPATLDGPQGRLVGENLTLVETADGQVVTMTGQPAIEDARFGGDETGSGGTVFTAGASGRIRLRPATAATVSPVEGAPAEDPEPADDSRAEAPPPAEGAAEEADEGVVTGAPAAPVAQGDPAERAELVEESAAAARGERIVLELQGAGFLETQGDQPDASFRIEGELVEIELEKTEIQAEEGTKTGIELRQLLATGNARGLFSGGHFTGDRILARPREGAQTGSGEFEVRVSPNPRVELLAAASGDEPARKITIHAPSGELTYLPPRNDEEQTAAIFSGRTFLEVEENGITTTTLSAGREVTLKMDRGAASSGEPEGPGRRGGLAALVAEGEVEFRNDLEQITGSGDHLELIPREDGGYRVVLKGIDERRAIATIGGESEDSKKIEALSIDYDPSTGNLLAEGRVEARFRGLDMAADLAPDEVRENGDGGLGVLMADRLLVFAPQGGEEGALALDAERPERDGDRQAARWGGEEGALALDAEGHVFFDDPGRHVSATGHRLIYRDDSDVIRMLGDGREHAYLIRRVPPEEGKPLRSVAVGGPLVLVDKATGELTCPEKGRVVLVRADPDGKNEERVEARSMGQVRYFEERLVLDRDVVIRFEEEREERRALWCDVATVFFADRNSPEQTEAAAGIGPGTGGVDRILAEGRVHLEQLSPRFLKAEGQRLDWRIGEKDEVMFLSGTNPQCWVVGLLGDKNVRDEADWFRFYKNSEEVQAENGRTIFIEEVSSL